MARPRKKKEHRPVAEMTREELEREVKHLRRTNGIYEKIKYEAEQGKRLSGRPILDALAAAGWTQSDLARALGVTQPAVSAWITGQTLIPLVRAQAVVAIFEGCGATPPAFDFSVGQKREPKKESKQDE